MSDKDTRDFKGVWIPKDVWLNPNLTFLEKGILAEIDSLSSEDKGCFASNEYLAEFCGCSVTKVSLAISKLVDLGYIYLANFNGRQRELKSRLSKSERQTFTKLKADIKKVKGTKVNNTSINIDYIINAFAFSENAVSSINQWLSYKKEKGQTYKETGLKTLLKRLKQLYDEKGEQALIGAIEHSMANNYSGIFEPTTKKTEKPKTRQGNFDIDDAFATALERTYGNGK
jgi:hypothetical protein